MRKKNNCKGQRLVDDFRMGNVEAFSGLFRLLYPRLCFYALRITDDQGTAEDITEESFIKLWDRRKSFTNYKVLRSFLYSTVRNACLNWLKQKKRRRTHENQIAIHAEITESSILENLIRAEIFNDLYAAFEKLPPKCRQIIAMIFFEGKNTREVAEELHLSIGTVKTQKARGLMLLGKRLMMLTLF